MVLTQKKKGVSTSARLLLTKEDEKCNKFGIQFEERESILAAISLTHLIDQFGFPTII